LERNEESEIGDKGVKLKTRGRGDGECMKRYRGDEGVRGKANSEFGVRSMKTAEGTKT